MEYYKGTYSFFRYPNDILVGFSPFLGYLNVKSGFLVKAFDMKRTHIPTGQGSRLYIEQLVDEIFHSVQGNLSATISPRKPIYIITKTGLLNEFITHVMINNIEEFKKRYGDKIIETHVQEYTEFLKCECNKIETENECTGYCSWTTEDDGSTKCQLRTTTTDIKNNKKKFIKNLHFFFELINNCISDTNISVPFYLLGLILMSYWYLIKNIIHDGSDEEYFNNYMNNIKSYVKNEKKYLYIDKIDKYISENELIELPISLNMIYAKFEDNEYPACFETVLNDFFNLLFYDDDSDTFIPKVKKYNLIQPIIDHYDYINKNKLDYTSKYIINRFVNLTTNIPNIKYTKMGYNIKSSYNNLLNILNYFLNSNSDNLINLLKEININVEMFDKENGILKLIIKKKNLELIIKPGHSFSRRQNKLKKLKKFDKDELFPIFLNFLLLNSMDNFDNYITFIDYYNMLNDSKISINKLPFHNYTIRDIDELNSLSKLSIFNLKITFFNLETIPDLTNLSNVSHIKILGNKIKNYPEKSLFPEYLRFLTIDSNVFNSSPKKIILPNNLKILRLTNNGIKSLPKGISFPDSLEILNLNNNELKSLQRGISFPDNLKILNLSNNKLNLIPSWIQFPNDLEELYLNDNKLSSFPNGVLILKNLKLLNLSYNKLKSLLNEDGKSISFPDTIKYLFLNNNKIKKLPEDNYGCISFPKNLKVLYLYGNELKSLPEKISFPDDMLILDMSYNNIKLLPEKISFPKDLILLDISNNKLKLLPDKISFPDKISTLKLNGNKLQFLPEKLILPNDLEELYINNNKLTYLPINISFPENIIIVYLYNNPFIKLPNYIINDKRFVKNF